MQTFKIQLGIILAALYLIESSRYRCMRSFGAPPNPFQGPLDCLCGGICCCVEALASSEVLLECLRFSAKSSRLMFMDLWSSRA